MEMLIRADNEERLAECEDELENLPNIYALKIHTHFISDITGLKEILDYLMSQTGGEGPNIKVGPFNINVNGDSSGGVNYDDKYAPRGIYDFEKDTEKLETTAKITAHGGLTVNDTKVSLEGHTHDEYALKDHNHDDRYSQLGHTHVMADITDLDTSSFDSKYAGKEHTHVMADITDLDTSSFDSKYAGKEHHHESKDISDKIKQYLAVPFQADTTFTVNGEDASTFEPYILVDTEVSALHFKEANIEANNVSFEYKGQPYGPPPYEDYIDVWHYVLTDSELEIKVDPTECDDLTVKIGEKTYVVHAITGQQEPATDMYSHLVMTANAVRGYVESKTPSKNIESKNITDRVNEYIKSADEYQYTVNGKPPYEFDSQILKCHNQIIYFYNLNFETDNIYAVYENQTYEYQTGTWLVGCWHIGSGLHDLEVISDTVDKSIEIHINSDTYNIHAYQATPTDMTSSQVMTAVVYTNGSFGAKEILSPKFPLEFVSWIPISFFYRLSSIPSNFPDT